MDITWHDNHPRSYDLLELRSCMNDSTKPSWQRLQADRSYNKIQRELKDKRLARLRSRLVMADAAGDHLEQWKIANQIKDYLKEERIA